MNYRSIPTRGRTLDHAADLYDLVEPWVMLGKQDEMNQQVTELLKIQPNHRILDVGCGTGVLTRLIARSLSHALGGMATGIDAAGKMIQGAMEKRACPTCDFHVAAAEALPFDDSAFDAVVSTLFFHHVPLDLKKLAMAEAFRVLKPGGRLVISDMHIPETFPGALIAHTSRWLLCQPEIGENIQGVLPGLMTEAGFFPPRKIKTYFGYICVFHTRKPGGNAS